MSRSMILKILVFTLTLMMALSMAACQTAAPTAAPTAVQTAASTPEQTVEATPTPAPVDYAWEKYESPVTVTTALRTDSSVTQLDNDTWDDNVWTREIESEFNIKVENLWTCDQSQYTTKLNLSIASGDLPDFYSVDNSQLVNVINSDLAYDMAAAFDKYASPDLKTIMNADQAGFNSGKVGDKLLAISTQDFGLVSMPNCIWIRDDWMKKLNLSAPQTLDDFVNICEAFTTQDPDGDGKNDTYGLAVSKNLYDTPSSSTGLGLTDLIFNAYHAYPGIWIKDATGKIVYGSVQPEMKQGLALLQSFTRTAASASSLA